MQASMYVHMYVRMYVRMFVCMLYVYHYMPITHVQMYVHV